MTIPMCKGAQDLTPNEMRRFRHVEGIFRANCLAWGYQEIRTPTLEYMHLFTSAGTLTPEMLSRVYSFLDWDGWSGERVVLRPDGTIPTARLYAGDFANMATARLYYVENMFSFEGTGRESRERWQFGVELMGASEPEGDAELIVLALEMLEKMDIGLINIKISHIGLFKSILCGLGLDEEEASKTLSEVLGGNVKALAGVGRQSAKTRDFLKILFSVQGNSLGFVENLRSTLPDELAGVKPCLDDLAVIAELLDSIGSNYEIDLSFGEGFEYYTGLVYHFYGSGELVGNGGRYDELIPLICGKAIPAAGFAIFVDGLLPLIKEPEAHSQAILVTKKSRGVRDLGIFFELANALRTLGYIVKLDNGNEKGFGCDWVVCIETDSIKSDLSLIDNRTGDRLKGLSADQLLAKLGESRCR